jgi:hypothetical protein
LRLLVARRQNCENEMNNPHPVDLQDPTLKARSTFSVISRKVTIGLLAALIVVTMIAWCGFLGWGILELLWTLVAWIKTSLV